MHIDIKNIYSTYPDFCICGSGAEQFIYTTKNKMPLHGTHISMTEVFKVVANEASNPCC